MRMPGYDTFGPQYPPAWDKVYKVICSRCGQEFNEDYATEIDGDIVCPECLEEEEDEGNR